MNTFYPFGQILNHNIIPMKKPNLNFKVGDQIISNTAKENSQILIIEYIDYTRNVYIFKEPWINRLSKITSINFDKAHFLFKFKD